MTPRPRANRGSAVAWRSLVLFSALVFLSGTAQAALNGPSNNERQITLVVTSLMRTEHLSGHPLDAEVAERALTTFLKSLDPGKLYFTRSDVKSIMQQREEFLRQMRRGEVQLGYDIFATFLKRMDDRIKMAMEFIDADHDFAVDEDIVSDADYVEYAADDAEARELWRKRIKYDLLAQKAAKTPLDETRAKLKRRYEGFAKRMRQTSDDELLEIYLTAFTTSYDPHSTYMSASSQENFNIIMALELEGIGAQLRFDDGFTLVDKVVPGGAAEKDGRLKPKDRIVAVGQGDDGEMVDVVDMKLSDVVKLVRGPRGTVVRLEVIPVGETDRKTYAITRERIELTDSEAKGRVFTEERDGRTVRVGVISLPSFYMDMEGARLNLPDYRSTTRDVAKILDGFRKENVDAVVLDLRHNGGGSLNEAISLTGLFIDTGPVVQVKDKNNRTRPFDDVERGVAWDGPLVVLTSKFSASASEIFAGAIQDYGRGLIVGDSTTHGKGTVQSYLDLGRQMFSVPNHPAMGALKITMQQFYRPNGDSTQNRGVQADVQLPSLTNELDVSEADLDYALPFDRIDAAQGLTKYDMVSPTVVAELAGKSSERIKNSPEFQKELRRIERYRQQKARHTVPLNEEKFLKERAELDAEAEEEKQIEEANNPDGGGIKRDYYIDEAIAVTLDYVNLVKTARPSQQAVGKR